MNAKVQAAFEASRRRRAGAIAEHEDELRQAWRLRAKTRSPALTAPALLALAGRIGDPDLLSDMARLALVEGDHRLDPISAQRILNDASDGDPALLDAAKTIAARAYELRTLWIPDVDDEETHWLDAGRDAV